MEICNNCKGNGEVMMVCSDDVGDICPPSCAGHPDTCSFCKGSGEFLPPPPENTYMHCDSAGHGMYCNCEDCV